MFGFIAIKAARALATLLICVTAVFVVLRMAGDPADMLLPDDTPSEIKAEYRVRWGLEGSIPEQYWRYMAALSRGDLGIAFADGRSAFDVVMEAVPNTFLLGISAIVLAMLIGFPAGILAALRHNRMADRVLMAFAVIGFSVPSFFFAILLILTFSLTLRWLPAAGTETVWHMILPTLALSAGLIGKLARYTRTAMLDVLGQPYMRTAKAKGVGHLMAMLRHALPNAAAPILMFLGIEIGLILTGAAVVETIFGWPGSAACWSLRQPPGTCRSCRASFCSWRLSSSCPIWRSISCMPCLIRALIFSVGRNGHERGAADISCGAYAAEAASLSSSGRICCELPYRDARHRGFGAMDCTA